MMRACIIPDLTSCVVTDHLWPLFAKGLTAKGVDARIDYGLDYRDDFILVWGTKQTYIMEKAKLLGIPVLVAELGYVGDRYKWMSIGWNDINAKACFYETDIPRHTPKYALKPFNFSEIKKVLLVGQVEGDATLGDVHIIDWLLKTNNKLKSKYEVLYRPHPKASSYMQTLLRSTEGSLEESFDAVDLVYTLSSNAGVDALLYGKPVVCEGEYSMCQHLSGIPLPGDEAYYTLQRDMWLERLLLKQWHITDIASGLFFDQLSRKFTG